MENELSSKNIGIYGLEEKMKSIAREYHYYMECDRL
jgi:hypothetical protein